MLKQIKRAKKLLVSTLKDIKTPKDVKRSPPKVSPALVVTTRSIRINSLD